MPWVDTRRTVRSVCRRVWATVSQPPPKPVTDEPEEILPFLPDPRPRCITPQPSADPPHREECLFFRRLPPEIRIQIYNHAFGNQTLHMDLSYIWPDTPRSRVAAEDGSTRHCAITPMESHPSYRDLDSTQPKAWRWWGSVCHREPPPHEMSVIRRWDLEPAPWYDKCRNGDVKYCAVWGGAWPARCQIGVMGWLLSCRLAYDETIDVLYRQNTLHIVSHAIFENLNRLFLAQRLSCISSLEIKFGTSIISMHRWASYRKAIDGIQNLFQVLTAQLPSLRTLHVTITSVFHIYTSVDFNPFLEAADKFIVANPALTRFTLSMPQGAFQRLWVEAQENRAPQHENGGIEKEVFRFLNGTYGFTDQDAQGTGLRWKRDRPLRSNSNECDNGYWVIEGQSNPHLFGL
ncbi:uncharacterized protein F5Z01DRAFT_265478 [Emericellopsis atlantica]|uniref:DUF7730 domain-containing protein n=1 Tax=Emericellopsis atlantica TaxID=2614577 RepID=A0A9P8CM62_9HYPO|nr:uncharacterized protein F5Z01DRAFT_265478 [Emericellopsis atlantica]KAG9251757.1 hypothetical protein F5Z01DRAFT_265478 [Emericellopsis atlantica]